VNAHIRLSAVVYVALASLSLLIEDARIVLVPAAIASIVLFVLGFVIFRRWTGAFTLPWPASLAEESVPEIIIAGTPCNQQPYDQELLVGFKVQRLPELTATIVLAALFLCGTLFNRLSAEPLIHGFNLFGLELVYLFAFAVPAMNLRWFAERRVLHKSYSSLGVISSRNPGFHQPEVIYEFRDHNSDRRGGRSQLGRSGTDNAVIVFFKPDNPDENIAQGAFQFHKFEVRLVPNHQNGKELDEPPA
jgi:hypothetical protein